MMTSTAVGILAVCFVSFCIAAFIYRQMKLRQNFLNNGSKSRIEKFEGHSRMYAFIPCVSGDDVRDNTPDSDIETTARLSPTVMKTDDDNEDIHFNMNVHRQGMYCMRQQDEGSAVNSPRSISNIPKRRPDKILHNGLIANAFKSFWDTGNVLCLTLRESSSKKHRFLEVTDPSLDHIISQSRAKAITSEDDLIAEMLKKEAYRVAIAHTLGSECKKSCQVFYTEGDVHDATHHSPVNPIFYESKARSVKVHLPLTTKITPTAVATAIMQHSSSSTLAAIEERANARSPGVLHSTLSTGSYTIRDNGNARRESISVSPAVSPSNRWGRSDASVIS